jgi:hypothetical protein
LLYDVRSKGALAYLRVAEEILRRLEADVPDGSRGDAPEGSRGEPAREGER